MRVLFRCDISAQTGSGHFKRCQKIARLLVSRGHVCFFLMNSVDIPEEPGIQYMSNISKSDEIAKFLRHDCRTWLALGSHKDAERLIRFGLLHKVDWVVVDHYGVDLEWEKKVGSNFDLMVIDDLVDRDHYCDLFLNPNVGAEEWGKLNLNVQQLLGLEFSIVSPLSGIEPGKFSKNVENKTVGVCFGGSDPTDESFKLWSALISSGSTELNWIFILGPLYRGKLCCSTAQSNINFIRSPKKVLHELSKCFVSFGAGGVMASERISIRLPSFLTSVADNQVNICKQIHALGYGFYLGSHSRMTIEEYEKVVVGLENYEIEEIAENCRDAIDFKGIERIAVALEQSRK